MLKPMRSRAESIAQAGALASLAVILSYLEAISGIDRVLPIAGIKLGFSNIAVLVAAIALSLPASLAIMLLKVIVTSFLFGTPTSFAFSLTGGMTAWAFTAFSVKCFKDRISAIGISTGASAFHVAGQFSAAAVILGNSELFGMLPLYFLMSLPSGIITGIVSELLIRKQIFFRRTGKH